LPIDPNSFCSYSCSCWRAPTLRKFGCVTLTRNLCHFLYLGTEVVVVAYWKWSNMRLNNEWI
jgi:hypothetical protein